LPGGTEENHKEFQSWYRKREEREKGQKAEE
jgi:hypothetical protein